MLNAFPLVSFPSLSLEPSSVSSLPLTPSALIERGAFVWDSNAMQLAGVLYCAFLLTQRAISVQSCADSTLLGDRGPTLSCVLVSSLALRFPTHAAGLCMQRVRSLPGAAPCKPPEIKSSEDLLD